MDGGSRNQLVRAIPPQTTTLQAPCHDLVPGLLGQEGKGAADQVCMVVPRTHTAHAAWLAAPSKSLHAAVANGWGGEVHAGGASMYPLQCVPTSARAPHQ